MPQTLLEPEEKSDNISQQQADNMFSNPQDLKEMESNPTGGFYKPGDSQEGLAATEKDAAATSEDANKRRGLYRLAGQEGSRRQRLLDRARGMSTKKKLAVAGAGTGLMGLVVVLILFMGFASGFGIEQLARILRDSAYAGLHISNYRRSTQYLIQGSLEDATVKGNGKLNKLGKPSWFQKARGIDPRKIATNMGNEGRLAFNFEDESVRWRPGSKTTLKSVTIDGKTIPAPEGGLNPLKNYRQHRDYVKKVSAAMNASDFFEEGGRAARSATANAVFDASGVKLYGWESKGRKIKNYADYIRSNYERVRGTKTSSVIPEVNDAADEFDEKVASATPEELAEGAEEFKTKKQLGVLNSSGGNLGNFAKNLSLVNLAGTMYCSAHDYISKQDDIVKAKIEQSKLSAGLLQSEADQFKHGDTTGPATTATARSISGFEKSYAYKSKVGTSPALLKEMPADFTADDLPAVDTSSLVYQFFSGIKQGVEGGRLTNGGEVKGFNPNDWAADRACPIVLKPGVQLASAIVEIVATAIASFYTVGGAGAAEQGFRIALQEGAEFTFKNVASRVARQVGTEGSKQLGAYFVISYLLDKLAGGDSPTFRSPQKKAATDDMGTKLLANDRAMALGGRELTDDEAVALEKLEYTTRLAQLAEKPLWYRLASFDNAYSPITQLAVAYPTNLGEAKTKSQNFAFSALNPVATVANSTSLVASARTVDQNMVFAYTAESRDQNKTYGIEKVGWSVDELDKMLVGDYWPAQNSELLELEEGDPDYNPAYDLKKLDDKYGKCFPSLGTDSASVSKARGADCSAQSLSSDEAFRYRLYRLDGGLSDEAPTESGDSQGLFGELLEAQEIVESFSGGSSNGQLPSGDAKTLAEQILANPRITYTTDLAEQAMRATAEGRPAAIESRCTNAGASSAPLSPTLLGVVLKIAEKYSVGYGYFTNGCHGDNSLHYVGKAVDIGTVNGVKANGGKPDETFMQYLTGILPNGSRMGVPSSCPASIGNATITPINQITLHDDSCNHIHIGVP